MIVYNVNRNWFELKADAEAYRIAEGLKPDATLKIEVDDRADLAALLNALCQAKEAPGVPAALIDRAYVPLENSVPACVPAFLLKDHHKEPSKLARHACTDCDCGWRGHEPNAPVELMGGTA